MSVRATSSATQELLMHYELGSILESPGGFVVTVYGRLDDADRKIIVITCGEHQASRQCPLSKETAQEMVDVLVSTHALPKDASFQHLVRHFIMRASRMYVDSGIDAFRLESIHLHQSSCVIGRAEVWHTHPLHLRPRQKSKGTLHESFPHMPGHAGLNGAER